MRLANGIVIDKEATFGALKFSALLFLMLLPYRQRVKCSW